MDLYNKKIAKRGDFKYLNCSCGFISDFKKRDRFSSPGSDYKRRTCMSEEAVQEWLKYVQDLMRNRKLCDIMNCDETSWKSFPNNTLTWTNTGSEDTQ